jgi:hypothetical protein
MALMSPELFYAIMAMGSASYEMKQYKIIPDRPSHRVLHFKGLALRTLSAKLQTDFNEVDMAAVLAITMLMGLDASGPHRSDCGTRRLTTNPDLVPRRPTCNDPSTRPA